MSLDEILDKKIRDLLSAKSCLDRRDLENLLRLLAKWRHTLISNTIVRRNGATVLSGPFAGLRTLGYVTEGCHAPRILGTYEHELHPHILRFSRIEFDVIVNIGCAEGYYAVGMARLMPNTEVHAFDIDEAAREACRELAAMNDVGDRVQIGGVFDRTDFARYADKKALVFIDIEGAEIDLLDPVDSSHFNRITIIVECHDCFKKEISSEIQIRFARSHNIIKIEQEISPASLPKWLGQLGHLDQLIALWEWRMGPTPWLIMEPK